MVLRILATMIVVPFQVHVEALKAPAAQHRRYDGVTDCTGNYTVLNTDVMDQCTPYIIPAPASIYVNQTNDTHYASYHYQGVQDCTGQGTLLSFWQVDSCVSFGTYSQIRVW